MLGITRRVRVVTRSDCVFATDLPIASLDREFSSTLIHEILSSLINCVALSFVNGRGSLGVNPFVYPIPIAVLVNCAIVWLAHKLLSFSNVIWSGYKKLCNLRFVTHVTPMIRYAHATTETYALRPFYSRTPMAIGEINSKLLADLLQTKRFQEGKSLREAGKAIGISAPTLQRIEGGQVPTSSTLSKLAEWLELGIEDLISTPKTNETRKDTIKQVEVLLRADPDLDHDAATTIANVARQVYDGFKKKRRKR